jgi:hypothetical protein
VAGMAIFIRAARRIVGGSRHAGSIPTCHGATANAAIIDIRLASHGDREKDLR